MSSSTEFRPGLPGAAQQDVTRAGDGPGPVPMPDLGSGRWERWAVADRPEVGQPGSERAAARAQGYAVGWAEGRRDAEAGILAERQLEVGRQAAAEAARRTEHAAAVRALQDAAERLDAALTEVCDRVDQQAARLALDLTRELVGRAPADADHVLARVRALLPDHPVLRVRLHPDVAAGAGDLRDHGVAVIADPALGHGDALVEADDHVLDLRASEALTRLAEVLA